MFAHAPDSEKYAPEYDLFIAGHSHGGQIKLPFLKPTWLPYGSSKFWRGEYQNLDDSMVYITRGIGTSVLSLRFNSVPEITICKFSKKNVEK